MIWHVAEDSDHQILKIYLYEIRLNLLQVFLLSVCFAAGTSVVVFQFVLWLRRAFKIEFFPELLCSFSARFCFLNLHRRFVLLRFFNAAAYDGF